MDIVVQTAPDIAPGAGAGAGVASIHKIDGFPGRGLINVSGASRSQVPPSIGQSKYPARGESLYSCVSLLVLLVMPHAREGSGVPSMR